MNQLFKNALSNRGLLVQIANRLIRNSNLFGILNPNAKTLIKVSTKSFQISALRLSNEVKKEEKTQKNSKVKTKRVAPVWTSSATNTNNQRLYLFNSYTRQKVNAFFWFELHFIKNFEI
jgi:hypothetical protein